MMTMGQLCRKAPGPKSQNVKVKLTEIRLGGFERERYWLIRGGSNVQQLAEFAENQILSTQLLIRHRNGPTREVIWHSLVFFFFFDTHSFHPLEAKYHLDHIDHIYFFMLDFGHFLAMKTCPSVNFYSVQISPNTSPAHRFHWLAAQFCTRGAGGICRNSQIGPRRSSGGPPLMIIVVPAALGLDHHVCLLAIVEHQVRPEKASKDKKLAFFYLVNGLELAQKQGRAPHRCHRMISHFIYLRYDNQELQDALEKYIYYKAKSLKIKARILCSISY